ncbi:hypothetical protein FHETE_801 [Fusarium heterosporum]|uniref:Uncharacterized protein n=1 Tax=Fusarium heterosporum TaxID=42747 RepID=A0A8H5X336_FUSHE|nr:hypothetical protein FHETE_801 [Fusarium heterosporum]
MQVSSKDEGDTTCTLIDGFGHTTDDTIDKKSGRAKTQALGLDASEVLPRSTTTFIVPPQQQRNRRWWHRIGLPSILVLTIGTGAILISLALLVFLWQGADRARARDSRAQSWDNIVFNDWSTRLVTICSAAIRVSMGFQIGLAAAAMAAVILETSGSRFSDTAMLSIQRAASSSAGPSSLIPTAWRHCRAGRISGLVYLLILTFGFIIALVSTLTSTILLFDFGQDQISAPLTTTVRSVGFDTQEMFPFNGISYWKSRPLAHWRFAETRPTEMETEFRTKNAVDTGDVYRAMLPYSNAEDRITLEYYEGPAVVINQRTACFRPSFDKISIEYELSDGSVTSGLYLNATYAVKGQDDFIGSAQSKEKKIFCRMHNQWNTSHPDVAPVSLCSGEFGTVPIENGTQNPLSGWAYGFDSVMLVSSGPALNGILPMANSKTGKPTAPEIRKELRKLKFLQDGSWTKAYTADGVEAFNATVCYISQNLPHRFNVTMNGRAVAAEPEFLAEWSSLTAKGNGTSILQQLGIGIESSNTRERGILDLQVHSGPEFWVNPKDTARIQKGYFLLWSTLVESSALGSWSFGGRIMTNDILTQITWPAHPEHSAVFQNIFHETGDPAQALQALVFRFYQMIYYDWLPNYDPTHSVTTINAKDVLIPETWTGFLIVLAIIIVHFVVVAFAMFLFAERTESSLLGNAWQAVSQMVSPETQDIIRAAGNEGMKDKEVAKLAKSTGRGNEAYALASGADNGRKELRIR